MAHSFSETLGTLPTPLQRLAKEPVWWAFLGSLGVHGIIFAVMPFISLPTPLSEESEIQREVSVIELEPGELSRVPDFSESQIEIPEIPDSEAFDGDDFYSFDDFSAQDDPMEDLDDYVPPLAPPPALDFSWPLPPPPVTFNPSPPVATSPQSPTTPAPTTPPPEDASPSPAPPLNPEVTPDPSQDLDSLSNPPQAPDQGQPNPPLSEERITERLLAEQAQLQELFTFDAEGTTEEDANLAFGTWFYEGLGKDLDELRRVELTPTFPAIACPISKGDDMTAVYGATVGADGVPVDDPQLIQSSGYEFFNREALKAIQQAEIPNESSEEQAFLITVRFVYDEAACPIHSQNEEAIS